MHSDKTVKLNKADCDQSPSVENPFQFPWNSIYVLSLFEDDSGFGMGKLSEIDGKTLLTEK